MIYIWVDARGGWGERHFISENQYKIVKSMSDSLLHLIINKSRTVKYREKKKRLFVEKKEL